MHCRAVVHAWAVCVYSPIWKSAALDNGHKLFSQGSGMWARSRIFHASVRQSSKATIRGKCGSVRQASFLVCGSSCFLLRSDQMTRVMVTLLATMSQPGELSTTCACARWCHLWWPWRPCGPIMRRTGTCCELPWVAHAHARVNSTRSRTVQTPRLFCWQACETNETGMKPE